MKGESPLLIRLLHCALNNSHSRTMTMGLILSQMEGSSHKTKEYPRDTGQER